MSILDKLFSGVGSATGKAVQAFNEARGPLPKFLSALAESKQYEMGPDEQAANEKAAFISSWVFSAVMMIVGEVAASQLRVIKRREDVIEEVFDHPFEILMKKPNSVMNRSFLWQFTALWLKLNGNAFWFKVFEDNELVELWPLPASSVVPVPDAKSRFVMAYDYTVQGIPYRIPKEYITHFINIPNPFNIFIGVSELVAAILPSRTDYAMSNWQNKFFEKGNVMPSSIINLSAGPNKRIAPADLLEIKRDLEDQYSAFQRKTLITTATDIAVNFLGWSAREMDFILGRKLTRKEIFEIYGVPEGATDASSTEANARIGDRKFRDAVWTRTLTPIAETITSDILIPHYDKKLEAIFGDIRPAVRELELLEMDRAKGALTIDEVRSKYWKLSALRDKLGESLYTGANVIPRGLEGGREPVDIEGVQVERPLTGPAGNQPLYEELKRWEKKSLTVVKRGGLANVPFDSGIISETLQELIRNQLLEMSSPEEVKGLFNSLKEATHAHISVK